MADTLFVTGRLAEPALRRVLAELEVPHQVAVMNITVAALMTTSWIAKRLQPPAGVDRIVIPGLCEGEIDAIADATGLPAEKGPVDVRALPEWYGRAAVRAQLGPRDVRVFAEINHVPYISRDEVIARAEAYRTAGADVIDLGLTLDRSWLEDGPGTIAALRERDFSLSIDTLDPEHIRMADAAGVDYVLSLTPETIGLADRLRATPVLITEDPDDLDGLGRMVDRMESLGRPYMLDSILAPINAGFAASLARYVELRRRHPEAELLMGIGNLTELTEADSAGVTALLIGFCQEVGIGAVLTTEVIGWAHGAVREAVLAAQIMHLAQAQGSPPKHVDPNLVTSKDERIRTPPESELREMHAKIRDPNYRLFADADWLYAFNADRFVRETNMFRVFEQLDVDDPSHAFYLGKELMKATIARGLRKTYRQEGPLDWGYMSFPRTTPRGPLVKKILIQLDTDRQASSFDAIAAYDSGVDIVLAYPEITPDNLAGVVQGAIFPRGPKGLENTTFWVGGADVRAGEAVFAAAQRFFFDPFRASIMLDSNGSNTTAAAGVARVRTIVELESGRVAIVGVGPVGLRTAQLMQRERATVTLLTFPPDVVEGTFRRASGIAAAEQAGFDVIEPRTSDELDELLRGHVAIFAAGPAGVQILRRSAWDGAPGLRVVADYSAAEPLGVEGVASTDDLEQENGVYKLGALAIGNRKMALQKECVGKLFESKGVVLDLDGVYEVALETL